LVAPAAVAVNKSKDQKSGGAVALQEWFSGEAPKMERRKG